jgi:hypothetical protein
MDRGRDKHDPRVDEEMKRESQGLEKGERSESRVEGSRKDEEVERDADEESEPGS